MAGVLGWIKKSWSEQFPHGFFVSEDSELKILMETEVRQVEFIEAGLV